MPLCRLVARPRGECPSQLLLPVHDCEAVRFEQRLLVGSVPQPLAFPDEAVQNRMDPPRRRSSRSGRSHRATRQKTAAHAPAYAATVLPAASRIHQRPVDEPRSSLVPMSPLPSGELSASCRRQRRFSLLDERRVFAAQAEKGRPYLGLPLHGARRLNPKIRSACAGDCGACAQRIQGCPRCPQATFPQARDHRSRPTPELRPAGCRHDSDPVWAS